MSKKITLKSSDGEIFEVDEVVVLESQTMKHLIEDDCAENGILSKVMEYCKKQTDEDLKAWDADFVKVDKSTIFDLIWAANYLYIKGLLDLTCQTVADMIKSKTSEEIRTP